MASLNIVAYSLEHVEPSGGSTTAILSDPSEELSSALHCTPSFLLATGGPFFVSSRCWQGFKCISARHGIRGCPFLVTHPSHDLNQLTPIPHTVSCRPHRLNRNALPPKIEDKTQNVPQIRHQIRTMPAQPIVQRKSKEMSQNVNEYLDWKPDIGHG